MLFTSFNSCFRRLLVSTVSLVPYLIFPTVTQAQLIPDDTLGVENSIVTPQQLRDLIEGGAIRGENLFHSFLEFNVNNGQQVYFANPEGILNILTRVTGSNLSHIDGILGVDGTANLFLLNPNGINFGENAFLDVSGSFFATTGSSFVFENGEEFSATNPQEAPLLKINITPGLQYGSPPQAAINNSGNLAVGTGQSLSLYGTEINNRGNLTATGGTVQLLGEVINLSGNSQIDVSSVNSGGVVNIGGDFQGSGKLPTARRVYVGEGVNINADGLVNSNGGTVIIWSEEVTGFYGNVTARGVNNGGLVEVSGKNYLIFRGSVDTTAVNGNSGILLLDPVNITIANGVGDETGDGTDSFAGNNSLTPGTILSAPLSDLEDDFPTTIYESELEGLSGNTNIVLQANNNITVEDLVDNELNFAAGSGGIAFTADADGDGIGSFVMEDVSDTIVTNGRNIFIAGVSLTLGNIDTSPSLGGELIATVDVDSGGAIPETGTSGTAIFTFTAPDIGETISNLDVRFSATHSYDFDLDVFLESPTGTVLELFSGVGSDGDNFQDTLLDDSAEISIVDGSAPFDGTFRPEGSLAVFNGENTAGVWTLTINDNFEGDSGELLRAGDVAPWGIARTAIGTQLLFRNPVTEGNSISGAITLSATNGNISTGNLNAISNSGMGEDITLEATGDITLNGSLAGHSNIFLNANNNITISDQVNNFINLGNGDGLINFIADANEDGFGSFVMEDITDTIVTNGRDIFIAGASLTVGNINYIFDAGQLLETAEVLATGPGVTLSSISGTLANSNDVDLFQIYLTGDRTFSASTIGSSSDTQLFLFNGQGIGVYSNDDEADCSCVQSVLPANNDLTPTDPGIYYLAVSSLDNDPISTEGHIFPNDFDFSNPFNIIIYSPTGSGGSLPLSNWDEQGAIDGDSYTINLTGVQGNISQFSEPISTEIIPNGGTITLQATNGSVSAGNLDASNISGEGGAITIEARESISVENLSSNSFVEDNAGNGGIINLQAGGNITTGNLNSSSVSNTDFTVPGNAGNGGDIIIVAEGNIFTGSLNSFSVAENGNAAGNGGVISLTAEGDITTLNIDSHSEASFFASDIVVNAGDGGAIFLTSTSGSFINIGNIDSSSDAFAGSVNGDTSAISSIAGSININLTGDILIGNIDTFSRAAAFPTTGNANATSSFGGNITINSSGNITTGNINTFSRAFAEIFAEGRNLGVAFAVPNTGGSINLNTSGNILTRNIDTSAVPDAVPNNLNANNFFGSAGNINLNSLAGTISTEDLVSIGEEQRGNINVNANSDIRINSVDVSGSGIGGNLQFTSQTGNFLMENGVISTNGSREGNGGNITIQANDITLINTDLNTTITGQGNAGNISIVVEDFLLLDASRLFTSLEPGAIGTGGDINIEGDSISLNNFSVINTSTFAQGNAGNVLIELEDSLFLNNSSIFSFSGGEGNAGEITVEAHNTVLLDNLSIISTAANSRGLGGNNINIEAGSLSLFNGSQLQALTQGSEKSGKIELYITDDVNISGIGGSGFLSGVFTTSEENSGGQGGNIIINTNGTLTLSEGAVLNAQTASNFSGGNITVQANLIELINGGQIITNTSGDGKAGNINVQANERIVIDDVDPNFNNRIISQPLPTQLPNPTSFSTRSESIEEQEPNNFFNEAQLINTFFLDSLDSTNPDTEFSTRIPYSSISGTGSETPTPDLYRFEVETAGTRGTFDIDNGINLNSQGQESTGSVNTFISLFDSNGNLLAENDDASDSLGADGSDSNNQDAYLRFVFSEPGTYFIQVDEVNGNGISNFDTYTLQVSLDTANVAGRVINNSAESGLFAQTEGAGAAGNITIETPQLTVQENSQISASTTNTGTGGNIEINATESVLITNQGTILTQSTGTGNAGNLTVNTPQLTLNQQAQISAATETATGGKITLDLNNLNINNSQISTSTQTGTAGDLNINATESITITGNSQSEAIQGLLAQATDGGIAGDLEINTQELNLESAQITVSSPEGEAGNLEINADNLFLNQGQLTSLTAENGAEGNDKEGANINLDVNKLLFLENQSLISATALENANGGNVDINAGFIIAPPFPDTFGSDIAANARFGDGGRVNITTDGLFGIAFQDFPTPLNDITASSEFGDRGIVTITQPNVDPAQSIIALPTDLIDATNLVARICPTGGREEVEKLGSFVVTGRGGLPPNPGEPLGDDSVSADLVSLENRETGNITDTQSQQNDTHPRQIVEAQGWIITENGKVILTAEPNTNHTLAISNSCSSF